MPPRSAVSCLEPRVSQTPMLTERTCVIRSVRIRSPLSRTSLTMGVLDKMKPGKSYATIEGSRALRNDEVTTGVIRGTVSTAAPRPDLSNLDLVELEAALESRGHKRFHARQIFRWIHKRGVTDVDAMSDLS